MKITTRAAYAKRIEAVLEHIHARPDADLDLARLADVAFMSPYHFHRVYVAMMGETVADTVRRQRLWSAAVALLSSAKPVDRIARDAAYTNTAAFVRAFRETYGVTPVQYRRHGELSAAMSGRPTSASSTSPKQGKTMFDLDQVVIQDQPEVHVLALEHTGSYQHIGRSFEKLMAWAAGKGLLEQPMRCYALYYDDPMSKPAEQLRSEACLAIERAGDVASVASIASIASIASVASVASVAKGDVHALTIRGGRCATYLFKGPYSDLDKPYRWLYDTWLEHSGEELAFEPPYEEYLNDARSTPPPELLTRICLPLKA
jgi:AraC family transcriptional regulator